MIVVSRQRNVQLALRAAPVVIGAGLLVVLLERMSVDMLGQSMAGMVNITPGLGLALLCCVALSLIAVAQFDPLAHRALETGLGTDEARMSGLGTLLATQAIGGGVLLAPLLRWWSVPGQGVARAAAVSAIVFIGFSVAVGVLSGLLLLAVSAGLVVALSALAIGLVALRALSPQRRHVMQGYLLWGGVDLLASALALWLLLPQASAPEFAVFLPIFAVAWLAGMLSAMPGGVGAMDLILIAALPMVGEVELVTALMTWRLLVLVLPAVLAPLLLWACRSRVIQRGVPCHRAYAQRSVWQPEMRRRLAHARSAESGLVRSAGLQLLSIGRCAIVTGRAGLHEVALFEPVSGRVEDLLHCLRRTDSTTPLFYKVGERSAARLRAEGFKLARVADEAVLDIRRGFDLEIPARKHLRRKLRLAERAGLRAMPARVTPDLLAEMAEIDAEWQATNGSAQGFSMGRFDPDLLAEQRVILLWQGSRLTGFVSFHATRSEWTLDLMRKRRECPDGGMYLAVVAGIVLAQFLSAERVSLAAVPPLAESLGEGVMPWLARRLSARMGRAGLRQFKQCFHPVWERRYAAGSSWLHLVSGLAAVAFAVNRPQLNAAVPPPSPARSVETLRDAA